MRYLGIDPGLKGAFAVINPSLEMDVWVSRLPLAGGELDVPTLARWWKFSRDHDTVAYIERAQSMPGQGVSSVFTYGKLFGQLLGIMGTLGIRAELVTPQRWKKVVLVGCDLGTQGDTPAVRKKKNKDAAIAWAARAYPNSPINGDGMADALCIADYARRSHGVVPRET